MGRWPGPIMSAFGGRPDAVLHASLLHRHMREWPKFLRPTSIMLAEIDPFVPGILAHLFDTTEMENEFVAVFYRLDGLLPSISYNPDNRAWGTMDGTASGKSIYSLYSYMEKTNASDTVVHIGVIIQRLLGEGK